MEFLPTASELAKFLADEATFPEQALDLPTIAQYYRLSLGRTKLLLKLKEIFEFNQELSMNT
jgi:hypothetical protein